MLHANPTGFSGSGYAFSISDFEIAAVAADVLICICAFNGALAIEQFPHGLEDRGGEAPWSHPDKLDLFRCSVRQRQPIDVDIPLAPPVLLSPRVPGCEACCFLEMVGVHQVRKVLQKLLP